MKRGPEMRWWTTHRDEVARHVVSLVQKLHEWDEPRRARLERAARLYGPGLSLGRWQNGSGLGALSMNVVRSLVQTASSSLLQVAPPRPWFLTDGGDPETQERAKGMTKLCTGVLYQTEFDAQARGDSLFSACLGDAVTKIFERDGEPCLERVMPWSLLVDERDGQDQRPRSIYQVCWVDRDVLRAQYLGHTSSPEEAAENDEDLEDDEDDERDERAELVRAIEDAGTCGLDDDFEHDSSTDQVCVLEAWHLPSRRGAKDGRHVICTDKGLLLEEPWTEEYFPFAFFHWQSRLTGFWSPGIADEIWTIQYEINLTIERIRQMLHTVAVPRIWIEESTKMRPSPMTNRIGGVHYYRGAKPVFETAQAVSPELWNYLEYLWAKAFQLLGISELAASAMKPSGVDSGKAMRVYADLTSGRMNGWSRNWLDYYLAVCKQLVRLMRRLSKSGRKGEVVYLDTRRKRLERVAWKDVALEDDEYVIQCFPVSSLPSSPAGRLQQLDEWRNAGLIDDYAYRKLLDLPDLDGEMGLLNAPREAIESAMHEMLRGRGRYIAPTSFDDLQLALRVGNLHYLQARTEGLPPDRLALVDRYLVETRRLMAEATAAAAPPAPPAPPGMPPGMPPDAMPPPGAMPPPPPDAPPAALPAAALPMPDSTPAPAPSDSSSGSKSLEALEAEAFQEALAELGGPSKKSPKASAGAEDDDDGDDPRPKPKNSKEKPTAKPKPKPKASAGDDGDDDGDEEGDDDGDGNRDTKPEKKPKPPEKLGESWKKLRETRDGLKAHEIHLTRREESLKARESAAEASVKEVEQLRAKASLVDRLLSGDPEAIQGLDVDFEKLTEAWLKAQSGDGKSSRLERDLQELKARLAKADEDRAKADEEKTKATKDQEHEKLYREAVTRLTTATKADKILSTFKDEQVVAMGEQVAMEFVEAKKPVPPPEQIAKIMAKRIREEYKAAAQRWAELDDGAEDEGAEEAEDDEEDVQPKAKPKAASQKPSSVSRRDGAERASSKKPYAYDPDEEAAELLGVFRGGRG